MESNWGCNIYFQLQSAPKQGSTSSFLPQNIIKNQCQILPGAKLGRGSSVEFLGAGFPVDLKPSRKTCEHFRRGLDLCPRYQTACPIQASRALLESKRTRTFKQ